jgi:amylosucrase
MLAAQQELLQKPYGSTWITYTRCHDDIGLGYDDHMIREAGFDPYQHRSYLKEYFSGSRSDSPARGALFSVNPKTNDARISGSLASLCGLEKAVEQHDAHSIELSMQKILLMQAHSLFLGGIPMLFYGDECAYTNDYSYLQDPGKSYDNRWMHRPIIDWKKNKKIDEKGTVEEKIFTGTQRLISIRQTLPALSDHKNLEWVSPHNIHVACFRRAMDKQQFYGVFNFSRETCHLTWYAFKERGIPAKELFDHWSGKLWDVGADNEYLIIAPYGFYLFEVNA